MILFPIAGTGGYPNRKCVPLCPIVSRFQVGRGEVPCAFSAVIPFLDNGVRQEHSKPLSLYKGFRGEYESHIRSCRRSCPGSIRR